MKPTPFLIKSSQIYTDSALVDGALLIEGKRIQKIIPSNELASVKNLTCLDFPDDHLVIPGMIDLHIHGLAGADIMDADSKSLQTISKKLPEEGTTSFLATTMTDSIPKIEAAIKNVNHTINHEKNCGAEILGIHLEGPFISPKRLGAHSTNYVLTPDIERFKAWQQLAGDAIKLVTLAPEQENALNFIHYLVANHVIASVGHTNASSEETKRAIEAGCSHATHLFNAMSGIHQREPGAAMPLLLSKKILAELIVDGVHLHPDTVNFCYQIKSKDKLILVTDSMRAKCCAEGSYDLAGQEVIVKNGQARLKNGTLAGSVLTMRDAFVNMMKYSQCDILDLIAMTAINPAKQLGLFDKKGSLAAGKDADIVVMDKDYNIRLTVCRGEIAFDNRLK